MRKRDYYDVLGALHGAPASEIRKAYRRLARLYSPDINLWDDRARGLFEEIAEAYRVLGDPSARALYDRLGHKAFEPARDGPEILARRGEDVQYAIELELEQALRGVGTVIEVTRFERCEACAGTGGIEASQPERCRTCGGRPVRIAIQRDIPTATRCGACQGVGWQLPKPCPACGGRGTRSQVVRIPVDIPPGVDTGAQLRLPGQGHAARAPAEPGDLVIMPRVRPHPFFTRKGDHLYCEVPITVPEAALGARVQIPTPDGPVAVTIPPGTQSGQLFRVRAKGCPRLDRDGRGDLVVAARVMIPRNTDSTIEEVLRALQRLLPENPRADLWGLPRVSP